MAIKKNYIMNLTVFGITHFLTDLMCHYYAFKLVPKEFPINLITLFVVYNFLAFAMQCPIGYLLDGLKPNISATFGFLSIAIGYACGFRFGRVGIIIGLILCGVGNAALHSAGSAGVMEKGKKGLIGGGFFIACGALGVGLGDYLGHRSDVNIVPVLLIASAILIEILSLNSKNQNRGQKGRNVGQIGRNDALCLVFCLLAVFARSYCSFILPGSFKELILLENIDPNNTISGMFSAFTGFFGKASGGLMVVLCMKFLRVKDLRKTNYAYGVAALVISTLLLCLGGTQPVCSLLGILIFNSVMPVTLYEVYCILPNKPGFALGLTTLMLFAGMLPAIAFTPSQETSVVLLSVFGVLAAAGLSIAMRFYILNNEKEPDIWKST